MEFKYHAFLCCLLIISYSNVYGMNDEMMRKEYKRVSALNSSYLDEIKQQEQKIVQFENDISRVKRDIAQETKNLPSEKEYKKVQVLTAAMVFTACFFLCVWVISDYLWGSDS